jgi:subtilisin-like proprotein convertase family protein
MKSNLYKRSRNWLLWCFFFTFFQGQAQVQIGGTPLLQTDNALSFNKIPFQIMPAFDQKAREAEDVIRDQYKDVPWRFGENFPVQFNLQNSGVWQTRADGSRVWHLGITCNGAYTINLTFDQFRLPEKARLFVFNQDFSHVIGAFTSENNAAHGQFATTLVRGASIMLEYIEPQNVDFQADLQINQVTHGYRDAYKSLAGLGQSGTCNNNVNCPVGTDWQCEKKSVVMLVSGGNGFCTGTVLNNTRQDATPYILTANHCYSNPATWVFWFNWESPTCVNPATSPPYTSATGATLKARRTDPDFCLVQLNAPIPANYAVTYAGWDKSGVIPNAAIAIHHPNGDIKKISFASPVNSGALGPITGTNAWQAWWTNGVTEPGSSGSALFNPNKQVIGQLYGGPSSCTAVAANKHDFYGKIAISWEGADATQRLKDWLDPTATGVSGLDGMGCSDFSLKLTTSDTALICNTGTILRTVQSTVAGAFNQAIALTISTLPIGVMMTLGTNTIGAGGATSLNINVSANAVAGQYPITLTGTSGNITRTAILTLIITGSPAVITGLSPADRATGVSSAPKCTWTAIPTATAYEIQIAEDAAFATILRTETVLTNTYQHITPVLEQGTVYYWRVRALNACGTGSYVNQGFQTNYCKSIMSTDVPKILPTAGTPTTTSTLTITAAQAVQIATMDAINITGKHTYMNDLDFTLLAPGGTPAMLLKGRTCGSADDFSFSFSDGAAVGAVPCSPIPVGQGGTYRPTQTLAAVAGRTSEGIWTLQIKDYATNDGGQLDSWGLSFCDAAAIPKAIPMAIGAFTADAEVTANGWTYYYKKAFTPPQTRQDLLILAVQKDTIVSITPAQVKAIVTNIGNAAHPAQSNRYMRGAEKWFVTNRYWEITPRSLADTQRLKVRFYYPTTDYDGLKSNISTLQTHDSLIGFSFHTNSNVDFTPTLHTGARVSNFRPSPIAHGTWGNYHYAEYSATHGAGGAVGAGGDGVLTIDWLSFTGQREGNANRLNWKTSSERDNAFFTLEHAKDGKNFTAIATIKGAGTTAIAQNYTWLDAKSLSKVHHYRLKQTGLDGKTSYAPNIVVITLADSEVENLKIFPNPTTDKIAILSAAENTLLTVKIYNSVGQQVHEGSFDSNLSYIVDMATWGNGIYLVQVQGGTIKSSVKILKTEKP